MYNCKKCPGYCCSYPLIALNKRDVERLAKHFRLSFRKAKAKFTVERWGHKYSMRRKKDHIFGGVCRFFDTEKRCCTVYDGAPVAVPQLPRRALRLLRLPVLRAPRPGGPRVHRHHQQQVTGRDAGERGPIFAA